jgi:hypothetical protein
MNAIPVLATFLSAAHPGGVERHHPHWGGRRALGRAGTGGIPAIDALLAHIEVARSAEGTIVSLGTGFRF